MMGDPNDQFPQGLPLFIRRRDVQEYKFVRSLLCIQCSQFDGIAGVADILEIDAFDRSSIFDIQAGYDPFCEQFSIFLR